MTETIKYTCSCCGKEHEEWPALVYVSRQTMKHYRKKIKKILRSFAQTFASLPTPTTRINLFVVL